MKGIYGRKLGMTRVFSEQGQSIPVTVLEVSPNMIYQVKTKDVDGYRALQIGLDMQKPQRVNKALTGHFSKAEKGSPKFVAEIRLDSSGKENDGEYNIGEAITIEGMFEPGEKVDVVGTSIGKGFAGVMKRHNMRGFIRTHGTHEYFRHGGSIGNRKFPGRVFKNKRMPGHMGSDRVLQHNLEVVAVRPSENLLLVKGSIPGPKSGYVFVRESIKS